MRVGPVQAQVLWWVCLQRNPSFTVSDVAFTLDLTYQSIDSAVRKLVAKGFIALVRPPKLGVPNLYEVTEKGRLWQTNFSG